ncbi:MAG: hypothetical protein H2172_16245 [Opitutus sp.]|nr:hypothetical protein [Opitutus sp.]MCS6244650.1 hypothetical protein [Opitutus sp.]MCS6245383.1 hypothetical protein [Opitutus sp.]MCS6248186.1 hypothetical protein [Opitutus sp.]MCS6274522.1 hypothetical protein [Opitutus sp.]
MSWITLTEANVLTKLSGPELTALKTAALGSGQINPLPEITSQIVREVRGYVRGCAGNTLGSGETIPDELLGPAITRIRFELATRLPVSSLLTEDRRSANANALALLRDVASGKFFVVTPAVPTTEATSTPSPSWSGRERTTTRSQQAGL